MALADLHPLGVDAPVAPRLPRLERLLARADRVAASGDWRAFLAAAWGVRAAGGSVPVAQTIAAAAGLAPDAGWQLATPLHLVAGLNHVRVHPAGPLTLAPDAAEALARDHARAFAGSGTSLLATRFGLLWKGPEAGPVETFDPDPYTGRDVAAALPRGPGAGLLGRAMTELQMWLHGRAVADDARIAPNALWLWGGTPGPALAPLIRPRYARAHAEPFLDALEALAPAGLAATTDEVACWRVAGLAGGGDAFAVAEERYFGWLEEVVRAGRHARIELWFGGHVYRLGRLQSLRVWRSPRPWWQGQEPGPGAGQSPC